MDQTTKCIQCGGIVDLTWSEQRDWGGRVVHTWLSSFDCRNNCLGRVLPDEYV